MEDVENPTKSIGYPDVVANMDRHLRDMYAYRDTLTAQATELNHRMEVTQQKIVRLETARATLLAYLDYVNAGEASVPAPFCIPGRGASLSCGQV